MTELDLILMVVSLGFTGTFTVLFYMVKYFASHKKESNDWKMKHSLKLDRVERKLEVVYNKDKEVK